MKKIVALLLVISLVLAAAGCSKRSEEEDTTTSSIGQQVDILYDGSFKGSGEGHNGTITVEVEVVGGVIGEVRLISESETSGVGSLAVKKILEGIQSTGKPKVDAVVGATYSSSGSMEAVANALNEAGASREFLESYGATAGESPLALGSSAYNFDVVVIGGGGSGLTAAITAAEGGAKVAVVEKNSFAGGTTLLSDGRVSVPGYSKASSGDSAALFLSDMERGNPQGVNSGLAQQFSQEALPAMEWLDGLGVEWEGTIKIPPHSEPRTLTAINGTGQQLVEQLVARAEDLGVVFFYNTTAVGLVEQEGRVVGAACIALDKGAIVNAAKGVIIATGGYGYNGTLRTTLSPLTDLNYRVNASSYNTGDGITIALPLGTKLVGIDNLQTTPFGTKQYGQPSPIAKTVLEHGALIVNHLGQPLVADGTDLKALTEEMLQAPQAFAYVVWDQAMADSAGLQAYQRELLGMARGQDLISGDSLGQVAEEFTVNAEVLAATAASKGFQPQGRVTIHRITPVVLYSLGGLAITPSAQVLNDDGQPINGLYAAGEVVGGIHGTQALEGNMLAAAIVFGRIAGTSAAA